MAKRIIGLDCETEDPLLKTAGWSWKYNEGYVLCTALYYEDSDRVEVIPGLKNEQSPYDLADRQRANKEIIDLFRSHDVCIVGANLQYDIGWLLHECNMTTYDVKCSFVDVLQAESILDEFNIHNLEEVSWKYLKYGKTKNRIEDWVHNNVSNKGDFRKYLKDAPYDLLCEYVAGDAKNPVKVWKRQLTLLKEQDLCARCKLEFDCILPSLQMTITGMPFDNEQRKKNLEELIEIRDKLKHEFEAKYGIKNFNVNSSAHIADLCERLHIPYRCKITLKGYNGEKFSDYKDTDSAFTRAKRVVSSFMFVKSVPVAYVPSELAERTCDLLEEEGFMFNCSPNIDKKFFASQRDNYEAIATIADWKLANGIISKILGDEYERFVCHDGKVRPQFNITDTISFRYSSSKPNCISESTRILTPKGYIPLYCLKKGDVVYNGNGDLTKIKNIWYKGKRKCLCLECANNKIIVTPEHKLWNGNKWQMASEMEVADVVERGKDCISLQKDAYSRTNRTNNGFVEIYNTRDFKKNNTLRRKESVENNAPSENFRSLYEIRFCKKICKRILFRTTTSFQRFMYQVQNFYKERAVFLKDIFNRRTKKRTAQLESSTSKVSIKWNEGKNTTNLQRRMFRQEGLYNCSKQESRVYPKKSNTQSCYGEGYRDFGREFTFRNGSTSYRQEPLKQQLGQLGSCFKTSTYKVTQTVERKQRVYDIEVESVDHSFIAEGFRVKNCQQLPSKNGLKVGDREFSFPAKIRTLCYAPKGCVFGKIDYGQIEYRLICNIACGDSGEEVRKKYAENPKLDFHQYVVDLTGLSRKYAKNMSFGVSFGMGLRSMADTFGWTIEKATEISEQYHQYMPFVAPTLALVGDVAKKRGYIITVCGSHARLPNPNKSYTMLNRYTQGSGAECLKSSIVQAYKEGVWERLQVANTVHDELNMPYVEVSRQGVIDLYRMAEIMRTSVKGLRVPLEAEPEFGTDWYNVHLLSEWVKFRDKGSSEWLETSQEVRDFVNEADKLMKEGVISI